MTTAQPTAPIGQNAPEVVEGLRLLDELLAAGRIAAATAGNVRAWLTGEPYAEFRLPLLELLRSRSADRLTELFWERIPFGTGGRRGPMSDWGSATINPRTIAESADGLARYLQITRDGSSAAGRVAIAYDSRHRSREFAELTASILAAYGNRVFTFREPRATPELSFAVRWLGCDAGVVISASHNPPADNGFKVYWSSGGQILPPHDRGIIECVDQAQHIPRCDFAAGLAAGQIEYVDERVDEAYVEAVSGLALTRPRDLSLLYTPLHGVGGSSVLPVLKRAGFEGGELFAPQAAPDGAFPTVPDHLPNPERPAVFGPAVTYAQSRDTQLILATDPDADRVAVMVRDAQGEFQFLTGNQLAGLIVDHVLRHRQAAGTLTPRHYVVTTLVTTRLVRTIATAYGIRTIDDLPVGFKWIGGTIDREGPEEFVFGAEESLGYLAGTYARDKDAAVGALYAAELAAELRAKGQTLLDRLDELYAQHGYYLEDQYSLTCAGADGQSRIGRILAAFQDHPPAALAAVRFHAVEDYARQQSRQLPSNAVQGPLAIPASKLLIVHGSHGPVRWRWGMRPSGTEPKMKFYFHLWVPTGAEQRTVAEARNLADESLTLLRQELLRWIESIP